MLPEIAPHFSRLTVASSASHCTRKGSSGDDELNPVFAAAAAVMYEPRQAEPTALCRVKRPKLCRAAGSLDVRIFENAKRYAQTRKNRDKTAMEQKYGRARLFNIKRAIRSRTRARVDRDRRALVVRLKKKSVDPEDYWEAILIERVRKDRALYAPFAGDVRIPNLLRPLPSRLRGGFAGPECDVRRSKRDKRRRLEEKGRSKDNYAKSKFRFKFKKRI